MELIKPLAELEHFLWFYDRKRLWKIAIFKNNILLHWTMPEENRGKQTHFWSQSEEIMVSTWTTWPYSVLNPIKHDLHVNVSERQVPNSQVTYRETNKDRKWKRNVSFGRVTCTIRSSSGYKTYRTQWKCSFFSSWGRGVSSWQWQVGG